MDDLEENFENLESTVDRITEVRSDRHLVLGRAKIEGATSGLDYEQKVAWSPTCETAASVACG